jgi:sortase A
MRGWRWGMSTVGRVLTALGLLLFGFVAYQLWGTGLETARAQRALASEFDELLATASTPASTPAAPPTSTLVPDAEPEPEQLGVDQPFGPIALGEPIARLEIPRLNVDNVVVAGVGVSELQQGPGHFPDTPLPGQLGNAAIAGHRTTYGQPFRNVDQLEPGDEIRITTIAGRFVYRVTGTQIVTPSQYEVVATTREDVAVITLVSCHPAWSAAQRIIISGELDPEASDEVGRPIRYGDLLEDSPTGLPGEDFTAPVPDRDLDLDPDLDPSPNLPDSTTDSESSTQVGTGGVGGGPGGAVEDAFGRGWFHDDGAYAPIALWGLLLSLISIGSYLLSRQFRRDLVGLSVGAVPFVISAFFFFQNLNRLLPPSL